MHHTGVVDPEIVEEVSRLTGYPADNVAESVKARIQDKVRGGRMDQEGGGGAQDLLRTEKNVPWG